MKAKLILKLLRAWLIFSLIGTVLISFAFLIPDLISGKIYDYSTDPRHWFLGSLFILQTLFIVLLPTVLAAAVLSSLNPRFSRTTILSILIVVAVGTFALLANMNFKGFQAKELAAFVSFAVIGAAVLWHASRPESRVEQDSDGKPDTVVS